MTFLFELPAYFMRINRHGFIDDLVKQIRRSLLAEPLLQIIREERLEFLRHPHKTFMSTFREEELL